jgi:hypothetical protein
VTANVYAPVTIRNTSGLGRPTVHAATVHAYSLRLIRGDDVTGLRTIFIDFE